MRGKEDETMLICLIPELCFLTGLDDRLRSNFTTMRELAKHTKVAPMQREQALRRYIESVNSKFRFNAFITALKIVSSMLIFFLNFNFR